MLFLAIDASSLFILAATQLMGILGLVACRLGEKCGHQLLCQVTFFLAFLLVASSTLFCVVMGNGAWAFSGAMLSLMAVGATLDCGGRQKVRPCH